jgi:hypothetical protein
MVMKFYDKKHEYSSFSYDLVVLPACSHCRFPDRLKSAPREFSFLSPPSPFSCEESTSFFE